MPEDFYVTPEDLVDEMVAAVTGREFATVLDPAAGDGRLLRAAAARWPGADVVAFEINHCRVTALRAAAPKWQTREVDYLAATEPVAVKGPVLVILNPPFSQRGAQTMAVPWPEGRTTRCGKAMAFVLRAAQLVERIGGEMIAIVPSGALTNMRDHDARSRLEERGLLTVVGEGTGHAFESVATNTTLVRWTAGNSLPTVDAAPSAVAKLRKLRVVRGALPVHKAVLLEGGDVAYLHTTSIADGMAVVPKLRISPRPCERVIHAPAVLVPRVGQPNVEKLTIYSGEPAVLSDCLYAIECSSDRVAVVLYESLLACWKELRAAYGGSCAPFLRQADLTHVLAEHERAVLRSAARAVQKIPA